MERETEAADENADSLGPGPQFTGELRKLVTDVAEQEPGREVGDPNDVKKVFLPAGDLRVSRDVPPRDPSPLVMNGSIIQDEEQKGDSRGEKKGELRLETEKESRNDGAHKIGSGPCQIECSDVPCQAGPRLTLGNPGLKRRPEEREAEAIECRKHQNNHDPPCDCRKET